MYLMVAWKENPECESATAKARRWGEELGSSPRRTWACRLLRKRSRVQSQNGIQRVRLNPETKEVGFIVLTSVTSESVPVRSAVSIQNVSSSVKSDGGSSDRDARTVSPVTVKKTEKDGVSAREEGRDVERGRVAKRMKEQNEEGKEGSRRSAEVEVP